MESERRGDDREVAAMSRTGQALLDLHVFIAKYGGITISRFPENHSVYLQGDPGDSVFYIQSGNVKLTVVSEFGKEAVFAVLETGHFFGTGSLVGHEQRRSSVTTLTECVLARMEKDAVCRALREDPSFSGLLITYLLNRNIRLKEDLIDQLFNSSERRLARALLLLADYGKEGWEKPVSPKIDQQTLAEMIGTTRSRVSYFMNKFRKLGFIDYDGEITVHSSLLSVLLQERSPIDY